MKEFFVIAGIVLNVIGMTVIGTGGAWCDGALLGWGGATSIVCGMYLDSIVG